LPPAAGHSPEPTAHPHFKSERTSRARYYDAIPQPRTPADIITRPGGATAAGEAAERKRGPAARGKWLTANHGGEGRPQEPSTCAR
jgi:hypothetical protein